MAKSPYSNFSNHIQVQSYRHRIYNKVLDAGDEEAKKDSQRGKQEKQTPCDYRDLF
jgi:hypothetical protein